MQIIFLPGAWAIILCFLVWPVLQTTAALLCSRMPEKWLDPGLFFFRAHRWEKDGSVYKTVFRVHVWKKYLPDSGTILPGTYKKKSLDDFSEANLRKYLLESCRAEMTHWFAIPPFLIFGLFTPSYVIGFMLIYALLVNVPCILAQRYNRPRILKFIEKSGHGNRDISGARGVE